MTDALNFTTKAIADLGDLAGSSTLAFGDKDGILFIQRMLQRAEIFVLPDAGELLDRSRARPQVPGAVFHPPFPVVALEYRAVRGSGGYHPIYESTIASKRIALAWEWDGLMPSGMSAKGRPAPGEGVVIASVCYIDAVRMWVPMTGAVMIPFDCMYRKAGPTDVMQAFVESGRITRQQAEADKIEIRGVLPIMAGTMGRLIAQEGEAGMLNLLSADLMDEVNAYIDLMTALACNNVGRERIAQPDRLNRARIKSGKAPLKDFHVLTIAGTEFAPGTRSGANGHGVRSHLRRGHIRRLGPERVTWVNSCMVRGSRAGFADKAYAVGSQAA